MSAATHFAGSALHFSPLPPGEGPGVRACDMALREKRHPHPNPLPEGEGAETAVRNISCEFGDFSVCMVGKRDLGFPRNRTACIGPETGVRGAHDNAQDLRKRQVHADFDRPAA